MPATLPASRLHLLPLLLLAALTVGCAAARPTADEQLIATLRPAPLTVGSYATPSWYPGSPVAGQRAGELRAAGRSPAVATVEEGVRLARADARRHLQAVFDDIHARALARLQAETDGHARTVVVVGTPDDTAAAMDTVGWSTIVDPATDIDAPDAGAALSDSRSGAAQGDLPEPDITCWAVSAPGMNGQRRVYCQLRLTRGAIDAAVSQALRHEWRRAHGAPPDGMDVLRIRQAIDDAWHARHQPE